MEISFESVASVLSQFDRTRDGEKNASHTSTIQAHSASAMGNKSYRKKEGKKC